MGIFSLLKIGRRALKCIPEFIMGDSAHIVGKAYKAAPKGSIWSKAKVAGKAFEKHVDKLHTTQGGFIKRLWKNTIGLPKALNFSRKAGVRLAKMKGTSAFMGGLKGIGKGLAKKMPYVGALLTLAFEAPNIIKGYKKDGVKGALKQCAGAATELGCMAAGAAIGSCIPGVGTVIGGLVGGIVGLVVRSKVAPEPDDQEEVQAPAPEVIDKNLEPERSSTNPSLGQSDSSLSPSDSSSDSDSSSSSSKSDSENSSSNSGSSSGNTNGTTQVTNPLTGFNPYGFGLNNPFAMGIGINNPFGGLNGMGLYNTPITAFTNTLLQPGENIFLKYPIGYRFQYLGQ